MNYKQLCSRVHWQIISCCWQMMIQMLHHIQSNGCGTSLKHLDHHWRCCNNHASPPCRWHKRASLMMARGGKGRDGTVLLCSTLWSEGCGYCSSNIMQCGNTYGTSTILYGMTHGSNIRQFVDETTCMRKSKFFSHVHCLAIIQLPNPPIGELNVQNTPGMITKNFHANNWHDTTTRIHPDWWPLIYCCIKCLQMIWFGFQSFYPNPLGKLNSMDGFSFSKEAWKQIPLCIIIHSLTCMYFSQPFSQWR